MINANVCGTESFRSLITSSSTTGRRSERGGVRGATEAKWGDLSSHLISVNTMNHAPAESARMSAR